MEKSADINLIRKDYKMAKKYIQWTIKFIYNEEDQTYQVKDYKVKRKVGTGQDKTLDGVDGPPDDGGTTGIWFKNNPFCFWHDGKRY